MMTRPIELFLDSGIQIINRKFSEETIRKKFNVSGEQLDTMIGQRWIRSFNAPFVRVFTERKADSISFAVAVDTTSGERKNGYIGTKEQVNNVDTLIPIYIDINNIQDIENSIITKFRVYDQKEFGDPVPVSIVLDIGNSRTCGLVIEDIRNDIPIRVSNFYPIQLISAQYPFSKSQTIFESTMELIPDIWDPVCGLYEIEIKQRNQLSDTLKRIIFGTLETSTYLNYFDNTTFSNNSIAAIGGDAIEWRRDTKQPNPSITSLSSPKRYLWDNNISNVNWHFANIRQGTTILEKIRGNILSYVDLIDSDNNISSSKIKPIAVDKGDEPRYPKRTFMIFYIYEILKSIYSQINSYDYRGRSNTPLQARYISDLILTYPSAMSGIVIDRFKKQTQKAINIFNTQYKMFKGDITTHVIWDEGVASQICYVYSKDTQFKTMNIASLDVGGGTIDLAVCKYENNDLDTRSVVCNVELTDGVYIGGDDLVQKLISEIVIKQLQNEIKNVVDIDLLHDIFKKRMNPSQRADRIGYLRDFLIPIAHRLLREMESDKDIVDLNIEDIISEKSKLYELGGKIYGPENAGDIANWTIIYRKNELEKIIRDYLGPSLVSLIKGIKKKKIDTILITGRLSSIPLFKKIVSEVIDDDLVDIISFNEVEEMMKICKDVFEEKNIDPKVSVILGAAIAFCGLKGKMSNGRKFSITYQKLKNNFFWGFIDPETKRFDKNRDLLFKPGDPLIKTLEVNGIQWIGRRFTYGENDVANPIYRLEVKGSQEITFKLKPHVNNGDEVIEIENNSKYAQLNLQTHIDEEYWFDSGFLK